ncbi:hypothetical protein M378DRAFT_156570 [Amanita muscaria Koide BX008]|uniref:Uncharacterized protein n=1 Tax=Amanita muscaria (strain Koide BX008) TaxID=946122 RepID=A0A0C2X7W9_AMAMK|nr:hypothetical protein M378DRAFT_156570 [Amanita muscaria Koide BX008]
MFKAYCYRASTRLRAADAECHPLSACDPEAFILDGSTWLLFYFHSFHFATRLSILDYNIGPSSFNARSFPSKSFHAFLTFYLPTSIDYRYIP